MAQYSHCIFDFDGTICDTAEDIISAINGVREQEYQAEPHSGEYIISCVGNGITNLVELCFGDIAAVDYQHAGHQVSVLYESFPPDQAPLYPGMREVLQQINLPCSIVSNKPARLIRPILESLQIDQYFQAVIGGDCFAYRKPDTRIFEQLKRLCPGGLEKAVMIGDGEPDHRFAADLGLDFIFCTYGYGSFSPKRAMRAEKAADILQHLSPH